LSFVLKSLKKIIFALSFETESKEQQ